MRIDILTLFPEMFIQTLGTSIIGRAQVGNLVEFHFWNIRDFAKDKHRVVDDTPYGGGAGMLLKPDVVVDSIEYVKRFNQGPVIYFTPQGQTFNQQQAKILSTEQELILLCGHYEGLDERVRENWVDLELSIGDYVLTGGELPAMVVIDAVVRLLPGVLGDDQSAKNDSFYDGLLEHPHYTRPANFRGLSVPDVLLSGHHEQIRRWRLKESLRRTYYRRPDLIKTRSLTDEEKLLLAEIVNECSDERG
ncbi:MAG: tRNA (guanosine(37)-N1)-methyltransferase TrmD [Firmicutes bacterium]|nr:tRNA (guanosine(37)-N1)-methyltransferase TrmD [Bacillota bacterium]